MWLVINVTNPDISKTSGEGIGIVSVQCRLKVIPTYSWLSTAVNMTFYGEEDNGLNLSSLDFYFLVKYQCTRFILNISTYYIVLYSNYNPFLSRSIDIFCLLTAVRFHFFIS